MYPNTFNPMNPNMGYPNQGSNNMMYPNQSDNNYLYDKVEKLEKKVARLERQLDRMEARVRRLEGGYPVPLSSNNDFNNENNHYMI